MNGIPQPSAEQRALRKRQLLDELTTVRQQKADVLRQIQQIAKKQRTTGPPPAIEGLSIEARRAAAQLEHKRRVEAIWGACLKIMQELLKNGTIKLYFGEPVRRDYAANYYDVIKHPMDLGTIKRKLESRQYTDVYGFLDDARLCFSNCRAYNPVGNHVRSVGDDASDKFEKKWVQGQIDHRWEEERQRYQLELERLEAESKSLPEKIKEVTSELEELTRKADSRAQPLHPGPGRDMTFEEKRKLSLALSSMSHDKLTIVMDVVSQDPGMGEQQDEDEEVEVELDFDKLSNETLWKLCSFVEEVQAQTASKQPANATPSAAPAATGGADAQAPAAADANNQAGGHAVNPPPSGGSSDGSDSEEVGSKGNAGSTYGDHGEPKKQSLGPGGHDLTTFVSATGPGMHPQILKNTGHKKDVQLQNANAWASLTAAAPAAPAAESPVQQQPEGAAGEEEEDHLWSEFQGREQQQRQQEEQKKALEEEERKKKEEEEAAVRKQAEEAKAAEQRKEEEKKQAIEQQREREAAQLQNLQKEAAEEGDQPDILRNVGQDSGANLAALGLVAREDDDEEELMDEEEI